MLIGVANKMQYLRRSWTLPNDSKHNEASFSTISTDKLYLRFAQTPRSPDLAIFVLTTDRQTDRRQTKPITLPLAHARGVIMTELCCYTFVVWACDKMGPGAQPPLFPKWGGGGGGGGAEAPLPPLFLRP